jgi:hypothetical protein
MAMRAFTGILAGATAMTMALAASAGEMEYRNGTGTWQATCAKPGTPALSVQDAEAINKALAALAADIEAYNTCVRREAESDLDEINKMVIEQARRAQEAAMAEYETTRERLSQLQQAQP